MKNKKILLGVAGGIASYKNCSLVNALKKNNNEVQVVMTNNATEFITPLTFEALSKRGVITDMFKNNEPEIIPHIYYPQEWADLFIISATANTLGKVANGIADDILTSMIIASTIPVVFIPSMNTHMFENKIVQENINKLKKYGYSFIEPTTGMLACGEIGKGKYPDLKTILESIETIIEKEQCL